MITYKLAKYKWVIGSDAYKKPFDWDYLFLSVVWLTFGIAPLALLGLLFIYGT